MSTSWRLTRTARALLAAGTLAGCATGTRQSTAKESPPATRPPRPVYRRLR
jgi:hypothetical protein